MSDERQSERYLRAVIELLHGVKLEQFDRDGRQRVVDYVFTKLAGVAGAVEMTTYQDGRAAAWESKMSSAETITCESLRGWAVIVRLDTKHDHLRLRLPSIIAACDRHGVDDPMRLPASESGAYIEWFTAVGLSLSPSTMSAPGTVAVHLPPTVGFPRNENLDRDLGQILSSSGVASKLRKLRDHADVTERHLAVGVHAHGSGFDLFDHLLSNRGYVPQYAPPDGFEATHVWVTAGYHSVLTWTRPGGWAWRAIPRAEEAGSGDAG